MTEPTFSMCLSFFSPQDDSIQSAVTPCCPQTSIPLLMACTANVKTVVANPMVYLTNLTHDILQTINALDSPPHPDVVNNEVRQSYLCISSSSTVDCLKWPFLLIERPWSLLKEASDHGKLESQYIHFSHWYLGNSEAYFFGMDFSVYIQVDLKDDISLLQLYLCEHACQPVT